MTRSKSGDNPIIVVGMHRSGTTMVTRMLREIGGHLGDDLSSTTCESLVFQQINTQLLYDFHASWHEPLPFWDVLQNDVRLEKATVKLRNRLSGIDIANFWGENGPNSRNGNSHRFWGWKDPRNTLTLPIWRRIYPNSKIVYIVRNGVDVACSLVQREKQDKQRPKTFELRARTLLRKGLVRLIPRRWPEYKPRAFTRDTAFELWVEYLKFADFATEEFAPENVLRLRYEDLLGEPLPTLRRIAEFVAGESENLDEIAGRINTLRRFAFAGDPQHCEFYQQHCQHPQMVKHGYDRILDHDDVKTSFR